MRKTLSDFATANPQHHNGRCWVGRLKERDEVNAAYLSGVPPKTIERWLRDECGYKEATYPKVSNHFQNGHAEDGCPS